MNFNHDEPLCVFGEEGKNLWIHIIYSSKAQTIFVYLVLGFGLWSILVFVGKKLMDVRGKKQGSAYCKNVSIDFAKITPSGLSLEQRFAKGRISQMDQRPRVPFPSVLNHCIPCADTCHSLPVRLPAHSQPPTHTHQEQTPLPSHVHLPSFTSAAWMGQLFLTYWRTQSPSTRKLFFRR